MAGSAPETPSLTLRLLGPFEACVFGRLIPDLRQRRGDRLLALLALRHGQVIERPWLAGMLWPESPAAPALNSLRSSLSALRGALGPAATHLRAPTPSTLSLDSNGADIDLLVFECCVRRGDTASLEQAVALYRGPFLEGCLEEWAFQERLAREQAVLEALEALAGGASQRGDLAAAEHHLRRAVSIDSVRETAQRALMQTLAARGNYAAVVEAYRDLHERLHREQNSEPDPETVALFRQIREEARRRDGETAKRRKGERPSASFADSPIRRLADSLSLPTGTVTFLFTDIEGSTRLWEEEPEKMRTALARHDELLRRAIEIHGGHVFKTLGDQFCAAFTTAPEALSAAVAARRALGELQSSPCLRVRIVLHTGVAEERASDYFGPPLNRIARLVAAGHGDQILLSLSAEELVRDHLPEGISLRDLGEHRLRDLLRPERIFQVVAPDLPADFPPLDTLNRRQHNLPAQPTPLIGRQEDLTALKQRLCRDDVRLVTLTGPGGTGKTRLALQVAAELLDAFPDGVYFVGLAPIRDPALVTSAIAQTLGVREGAEGTLLERLQRHLEPRQMLLLLDNLEQILDAAPTLSDLLATAPQLKLLVTSRAVLRLRGEHEFPVLPLPTPPLSVGADLARALTQYAAIELFIQRAVAAKPEFAVTNENAPAVAEICRRLDGLPLAIELAAARIRLLPPQGLLARLKNRLQLLTGGPRDLPARQQTLRDTIAWSYELLTPEEKALFWRLSVFVGGFTLEAAEAVCGGVLDGIASLHDQSLLRQVEVDGGEPRFGILETIREFGLDRLAESGEEATIRRRHADHFLAFAESDVGPDRLEGEHDNLRSVLDWTMEHGEIEAGLRVASAMWFFWNIRGYLSEGWQRVTALLTRSGSEVYPQLRAGVLNGAGHLAITRGDYPTARACYEQCLTIRRGLGYEEEVASTLQMLAEVATHQKECEAARGFIEEAGVIRRKLDDKSGMVGCLNSLGEIARVEGDYPQARIFYEEGIGIAEELGAAFQLAMLQANMGHVANFQGEPELASQLLRASLTPFQESGHKPFLAACLAGLGGTAELQNQPERAARLLGAVEALLESMGAVMQTVDRDEYERYAAAVRARLDEAAFAAAWAEGRAMGLEDAVAYAMEDEETA